MPVLSDGDSIARSTPLSAQAKDIFPRADESQALDPVHKGAPKSNCMSCLSIGLNTLPPPSVRMKEVEERKQNKPSG